VNPFTAGDVAAILREQGMVAPRGRSRRLRVGLPLFTPTSEGETAANWTADAAALLGPRAENREAFTRLLALVFEYDAHACSLHGNARRFLGRDGARQVLRALATEILAGVPWIRTV